MNDTARTAACFCVALGLLWPLAASAQQAAEQPSWVQPLAERLPTFGHRNWIVIADMAYPAQSRPGIETVYIGGDQAQAVSSVLSLLDAAPHLRGIVHLDAELNSVSEEDAPGITTYRRELAQLLKQRPLFRTPHEKIIARLDEAAKLFRVLVLKTDMTLPYTSVFVELDCGYWSADAEQRLRKAMKQQKK